MSAPLQSTANPETVLPQPPAPDTHPDTERLNWLERAGGVVISVVPENAERNQCMVWAKAINYIGKGDSLRAAIDNAQLPAASEVANPESVNRLAASFVKEG